MIINNKQGKDILKGEEHHIAFAVNTEGVNDSGFAGIIARRYWPELAYVGASKLGTVIAKEVEGIHFYALVCHSLEKGWKQQTSIICQCFDAIDTDEVIASISIGTGFIGVVLGANFYDIKAGMEQSKKRIVLY